MLTKLTLTIDQAVVEQAKAYAQKKHRSVSRIVEEYLKNVSMTQKTIPVIDGLKSPITDSLSGMFQDSGKSYQEMLDEALIEKYL